MTGGDIAIPLSDILAAQQRLVGTVVRTPLVHLNLEDVPADIYLKLENLQPIGAFKLRGAINAMALADPETLKQGVYTASAGNMAQGVAWAARERGIPCTVIVPDHAPETKLAAIDRLGGEVVKVPHARWWQTLVDRSYPGMEGLFIHPVSDPAVIAGNGTVGLEILEDLPDVDTIVAPFGGGGLIVGIASAVRALKPETTVYASEVETAAPLAPSLAAGSPQTVTYAPTFIDGMGGPALLADMWPLIRLLVDGSLVVSVKQVADAIRILALRNRVIAEGAGAASLAAALSGQAGNGKVVCVVSGGNLDVARLITILQGGVP